MNKNNIENCAISGIKLDLSDVATVSRSALRYGGTKVVTLRHTYPENGDGRIWDGVNAALHHGAKEIFAADVRVERVEVWSRGGGWQVSEIERED